MLVMLVGAWLPAGAAAMSEGASVISGQVLTQDGHPPILAHVHVIRPGDSRPLASVEVGSDGSYRIERALPGLFELLFTAVDHEQKALVLLQDNPGALRVEIRMSRHAYANDFRDVRAFGDFNDYSPHAAEPLLRQPDGSLILEITTDAPRVRYQLLGVHAQGRTINGTESDAYVYDGQGDYYSIADVDEGRARIIFNPDLLARESVPAQYQVQPSRAARIAGVFERADAHYQRRRRAGLAYRRLGGSIDTFVYNEKPFQQSVARQLEKEPDALVRNALLLSALRSEDASAELAAQALVTIGPGSPQWSYLAGLALIHGLVNAAPWEGKYRSKWTVHLNAQLESHGAFVDQVLATQPNPAVKAQLLYYSIFAAANAGREDIVPGLYERLVREFPDDYWAGIARTRFGPDARIRVSYPVPDFSLELMGNDSAQISKASMLDKVYLLDFWASWCPPCLKEMPWLHEAHERFSELGLEIISLSFDDAPEDVLEFRQGKWTMPWHHHYVRDGFDSATAKRFKVFFIPAIFLIDRDGTIRALGKTLRGQELLDTLEQVLATSTAGSAAG